MRRFMEFTSGLDGRFDAKTARRIRTINVAVILIAAFMAIPMSLMLMSENNGWFKSGLINLGLVATLIPIIFAHYFGYVVKITYLGLWFVAYVAIFTTFGTVNGTHYTLLAVPAVSLALMGPRMWPIAAILTVIATIAFATIDNLVPDTIKWSQDFWTAIRDFNEDGSNFTQFGVNYLVVVSGVEFIIFAVVYAALSALEASEDALAREFARSEHLLGSMLPASVMARLKDAPGTQIADKVADATILFADLVGFTRFASGTPAEDVVAVLNEIFSEFDALVEEHRLERIKTIGDAYMVAGGLNDDDPDHSERMADLAFAMIDVLERIFAERQLDMSVRIGIHKGPAVAGVVGSKRPFFDVWGDTVNVASRMQSTAPPGSVQITPELRDVLSGSHDVASQSDVEVKGKGKMASFVLRRRN